MPRSVAQDVAQSVVAEASAKKSGVAAASAASDALPAKEATEAQCDAALEQADGQCARPQAEKAQDMPLEAEVNGVEGHTEKTNVTRAMTDNVDEVVHVAAPKKSGRRSSKAKKSVVEAQAKAVAYQVSGLAE